MSDRMSADPAVPTAVEAPQTFLDDPQFLTATIERLAPVLEPLPADQLQLALGYVLGRISVQQIAEVLDRVLVEVERAPSREALVGAIRPHLEAYRAVAEQYSIPLTVQQSGQAPVPEPTTETDRYIGVYL